MKTKNLVFAAFTFNTSLKCSDDFFCLNFYLKSYRLVCLHCNIEQSLSIGKHLYRN